MKKESEFGKGLVYNLILFAKHFEREDIKSIHWFDKNPIPKKDLKKPINLGWGDKQPIHYSPFYIARRMINGSHKEAISHAIEMWANAASDHLYEIETPKGWEKFKVGKMIRELNNLGLEMGHGFGHKRLWTTKDLDHLKQLTEDIGLQIDKKLGVKPIEATYK